jgi:hypothetical protein
MEEEQTMTKVNVKWMAVLAALAGAPALQAGFIAITCTGKYVDEICVSAPASIIDHSGTTTFTYDAQYSGAIIGGTPTLGAFAQMTVADPNGVPQTEVMNAFSSISFTDTVTAAPAPVYAFNFNLHTIHSSNNYANGFHDVYTNLLLVVKAYDNLNNLLWITGHSDFPPTKVIAPGTTTTAISYKTPLSFSNPNVAKLSITLGLTAAVFYSNLANTSSTSVTAFADASHTVSFESIEAQDSLGGSLPGSFISSEGADYSASAAVPEPASCVLVALGLAAAAWRRRA